MADYIAARASVVIAPTMKGFAEKLKAQLSAIDAVLSIDLDADTAEFKQRLNTAIEAIEAAAPAVDVHVEASAEDVAAAQAAIANAAQDQTAEITAQAETATAKAELALLTRPEEKRIVADVDTAAVRRGLAAVTDGLFSVIGAASRLGAVAVGIGAIGVAAAGTVGPLAAMTAGLLQASGAAAALPGMFAGVGAGLGALIVGAKGVGGAFSAMGKQAAAGGGSAAKSAGNAAKAIRDAELGVAQAQRRSEQAQRELNKARKDAVKDLRDLNAQLKDAALDEEDAALAVARAKQRLAETNADPQASKLDRAEADLEYRKALRNLEDTRQKNNDLAKEVHEANQRGVEGSEKVLAAKEQVAQATEAERQAQERLVEAMESLADAAGGAAGGVDAFSEALSKLAPSAREFVLAVKALGPAWSQVRLDTQQALFAGLGASVTELARVQLPVLRTGLAGLASEINSGVRAQIQALSSEASRSQLGALLTNAAAGLRNANAAAGPFAQTMMNLFAAGSNYLPVFGTWVATITQRFNDFINGAIADGRFDQWVQTGVAGLRAIGSTLANLGGIISGVFKAAAAAGEGALAPMGAVLQQLNAFVNSTDGQQALTTFFSAMQAGLAAILPVVLSLAQTFGTVFMPMVAQLLQAAAPGLQGFVNGLRSALESLAPHMPALGQAIGQLASSFGNFLANAAPVVGLLIDVLAPYLPQIVGGILGMMAISKVVSVFQLFQPVLGLVTKLVPMLTRGLLGFLGPVGIAIGVVTLLWGAFKLAYDHIGWFHDAVDKVVAMLKAGFARAIENAKTRIGALGEKFNGAKERVKQFVSDTVDWFKRIPEEIGKLGSALAQAGKNIISSIWEGMKEKFRDVKNWFSSAFTFGRGRGSTEADGSVRTYANGGLTWGGKLSDQQPGIVPGGSWVVMAEDETQGESFIPHAPGKRKRATQILKQTANIFGLDVVNPKTGLPVKRDGSSVAPKTRFFADGGITVDDLDQFAQGLEGQPYVWGGVHWGDCSGAMSAISRFAVGLDPWGGRFATGSEAGALQQMGFTLGKGKPGDLRIGWFNGGPYGGHTAGTLPSGVNVEMGGARGDGQYGGSAAGDDSAQFTDHAYLPNAFFKQIEVPQLSESDDAELTAALDDESAQALVDARESGATNPDSYSGAGSDTPTSWSDALGEFAKTAVAGHTKELLDYLGLPDELPPAVQAYNQAVKLAGNSRSDQNTSLSRVEIAAQRLIDQLPAGVKTVAVSGAQLLGLRVSDPGFLPGGDPLRIPGFASGGLVAGAGTGTSDSILARLSNGEFVMRAAATQANRPLLEALNAQPNLLSAGTGAAAKPVEVHYHITATNVDEGMRLAEQRSRLQVSAMMGV